MTDEKQLYNFYLPYLPPTMDAIRIENKCIPGCFDVYLRHKCGNQIWLENKIANANEKVCFEPSQYLFMLEHVHRYNGKAAAIIATRSSFREFFVINFVNIPRLYMLKLCHEHKTPNEYEELSTINHLGFFSRHQSIKSAIERIERICIS